MSSLKYFFQLYYKIYLPMNDFNLKEIILYEDEHILALNKPAGILSIEDGYDVKKINLRSCLRDMYGTIWAVHRLDKYTSGVIIFSKTENSHRKFNALFSSHETNKNYRAIIHGFPIWNSYEINLPLKVNGDKKHRTVIDMANGKPALTLVKPLSRCANYSYLDIFPRTGLTHQIRAHLSAIGFPIFGDDLYWRCCEIRNSKISTPVYYFERYYLHAYSLKFPHPTSNEMMTIIAPVPFSFNQLLKEMKLYETC